MLRKLMFMVAFVAVLAMVTPATAVVPKTDYSYDEESWWSGFGSDDPQMWSNADNWWTGGNPEPVPKDVDFASIGDPPEQAYATIASGDAVCKVLFIGDWQPTSSLTVTGGTLTVGTDIILGNRINVVPCDGTLEMTGGTVTLLDDLIISIDGPGDVNVGSGALLEIGGDLNIGNQGQLLISGTGLVTFDEDKTFEVSSLIGANKIYAPDGYLPGCDYDATVSGKTAVFTVVVDPCQAHSPSPVGTDAELTNIMLAWTAGLSGGSTAPDSHDVYYGSSYTGVRDATTGSGEFQGNTTDPCWPISETLAYADTRFWRVDERYSSDTVKGNIWNFTARNYLLIETFNTDRYADNTALRAVWVKNANALAFAHVEDTIKDGTIAGSDQSMRLEYDNDDGDVYLSEVTRTFDPNEDWGAGGSVTLAIYVHGLDDNSEENIYVVLTDADSSSDYVMFPSQPLLMQQTRESWHLWLTPLTDFSGVDKSIIESITLGVGDKASPSSPGAVFGNMYFEDIRVYPRACFAKIPPFVGRDDDGDLDDDCDIDFDDIDEFSGEWLDVNYVVTSAVAPNSAGLILHYEFDETGGTVVKDSVHDDADHNGELTDAVCWAPTGGKYGGALDFNGTNYKNYVTMPPNAIDSSIGGEVTLSFWMKTDGQDNLQTEGVGVFNHDGISAYMPFNGNMGINLGSNPDSKEGDYVEWGPAGGYGNPDYDYEVWNHIACVKSLSDGRSGTIKLYYNGELVAKENGTIWPSKGDVNTANLEYANIGCWKYQSVTEGFYMGMLDDMRLYDYALSDEEVLSLAEKSSMSQPCVSSGNIDDSNEKVDFTDLAILASGWNTEPLWP